MNNQKLQNLFFSQFQKNLFYFKSFFIWKLCKIICTKSQVTVAENLNLKMMT